MAPPVAGLLVGMAGSGKTTLVQRISAHLSQHARPSYLVNLDPAVSSVPYAPNIDIRDTVNYKEVMRAYNIGPNGAILTALNLFATRFDAVLDLLEKRQRGTSDGGGGDGETAALEYAFFDTPGQIEVFTWSASGSIITESLAAAAELPTALLYVVDMPRCAANAMTFSSNMLYACSMLYKSRLPLVVVFNKRDCVSREDAAAMEQWLRDADAFQNAVSEESGYAGTLAFSMALALDAFYRHVRCVQVSAATGEGMHELMAAIDEARREYEGGFLQEVRRKRAEAAQAEEARVRRELDKMRLDAGDGVPDSAGASSSERRAHDDAAEAEADADAGLNGDGATARERLASRAARAEREHRRAMLRGREAGPDEGGDVEETVERGGMPLTLRSRHTLAKQAVPPCGERPAGADASSSANAHSAATHEQRERVAQRVASAAQDASSSRRQQQQQQKTTTTTSDRHEDDDAAYRAFARYMQGSEP